MGVWMREPIRGEHAPDTRISNEIEPMPHLTAEPSTVGRLWADATTVQNTADAFAADSELAGLAISVFEQPDGRWLLELYFRDPPDEPAARAIVKSAAGAEASHALAFETLAPTDWIKKSREGLNPVLAGRFAVHAAHDRSRIAANRIAIEIEASLAFGTGHHGSTRGCLVALDRIARRLTSKARRRPAGSRPPDPGSKALVLDVGTGSGVLAIAAAKALRRRIVASDLDRRAVTIARENVRLNGVAAYVEVFRLAGVRAHRFRARGPYALILANILLEPLRPMAMPMARLLAPGGQAVLSGLLIGQANAALAAYRARGFALARRIICEGWATLVLVRRARRNSQ
jgi:ribosomal protein L11 methyltransferase